MECENHPGVEPRARCVGCGRLLCADCMVESGGRTFCCSCVPCLETEARPPGSFERWFEGLDLTRAFTFPLDDPEWVRKLLVGSALMLLSFLVVPALIALGYALEAFGAAASGKDTRLPSWDGIGGKLRKGAKLVIAGLVYSLPLLLVFGGTVALGVAAGGGVRGVWRGLAVMVFMLGWLVSLALALGVMLVMPAVISKLAATGRLRESLSFGAVARETRAGIRKYLVVLLASVTLFFFLAPLGCVACLLGGAVTSFYCLLVAFNLYGQLARRGGGAGGE